MRLVDADALKTRIKEGIDYIGGADIDDAYYNGEKSALNAVINMINSTPIIEAEPVRRGKWEIAGYGNWLCPECGKTVVHDMDIHFCPKCGMRLERPDNEYEYYFGHD